MPRRSPWTPIFNPDPSRGAISVGATPGTPPPQEIAYITQLAGSVISPQGIAMIGDHVFIPGNVTSSLVSFDISTPTSPSVAQTLSPLTGGSFNSVNANHIATDGVSNLYVSSTWQLRVIDATDPTSMSVTGTTASEATNLATSNGIFYDAGYCYVSVFGGDRLTVVDVSTPSSPAVVGTVTDGTNLNGARAVYKSGSYAYVSGTDGIGVVDVSTPASPTVVDFLSLATGANLFQAALTGTSLFVARPGSPHLYSIDITTPTAIAVDDSLALDNDSYPMVHLHAAGKLLALGAATGYGVLVNSSDPSNMSVESSVSGISLDEPRGAVSSGSYFFLADQTYNGLRVYQVA